MKVKDLMTKDIVTITKGSLITDAANMMKKKDISCLVVTCGETIEGIITERDVMRKIIASQKMLHQIEVRDIMSSPVATIDEDADIFDALDMLRKKHIRRVVAVNKNKKMAGIITQSDFMKLIQKKSMIMIPP